jgi:tetratricopeptide (TPR) repeat protein
MRLSSLALVATVAFPASAIASVLTIGGGYAEGCFHAAEDRDAGRNAMETCDRAMTEEGLTRHDRVATHVNRGILYLIRNDVEAANDDFDAALKLDPNEPDAWLNKAVAHARFGKSRDAMPYVTKALELNTRRPALAYFVRAMALEDIGNVAGAYYDLKKAQALEPKWSEPTAELKRFQVRRP